MGTHTATGIGRNGTATDSVDSDSASAQLFCQITGQHLSGDFQGRTGAASRYRNVGHC
jgi:hypothetical protein